MLTKQHVAISFKAMMDKGHSMDRIRQELPYILLPDGIRAYVGPRAASHFESLPDHSDTAWMKFPNESELKSMSKENCSIQWYVPDGFPKAAIGEETQFEIFAQHNWAHKHFHALSMHIVQDMTLDETLREKMIDPSRRFGDEFSLRSEPGRIIDGKELRAQVTLFEELGFLKLVGAVWNSTGVLLDRDWFNANVETALYSAYPADLAANTYKFMSISDEINHRIKARNFALTPEEIESVYIAGGKLEEILDEMYAKAYILSCIV